MIRSAGHQLLIITAESESSMVYVYLTKPHPQCAPGRVGRVPLPIGVLGALCCEGRMVNAES
jgi:hypothetical protein